MLRVCVCVCEREREREGERERAHVLAGMCSDNYQMSGNTTNIATFFLVSANLCQYIAEQAVTELGYFGFGTTTDHLSSQRAPCRLLMPQGRDTIHAVAKRNSRNRHLLAHNSMSTLSLSGLAWPAHTWRWHMWSVRYVQVNSFFLLVFCLVCVCVWVCFINLFICWCATNKQNSGLQKVCFN